MHTWDPQARKLSGPHCRLQLPASAGADQLRTDIAGQLSPPPDFWLRLVTVDKRLGAPVLGHLEAQLGAGTAHAVAVQPPPTSTPLSEMCLLVSVVQYFPDTKTYDADDSFEMVLSSDWTVAQLKNEIRSRCVCVCARACVLLHALIRCCTKGLPRGLHAGAAEHNLFLVAEGPRVASTCFGALPEEQGSEVPSLGTFSGTLSGKWAKVGKMGENGGKRGKFRFLGGKMGNLWAEKAKNQGFSWQRGCGGGGALVKAPEEKWGKMGENGGKWGKMGENGEEMGRKWEDKWGSFRLLNRKAVWRA